MLGRSSLLSCCFIKSFMVSKQSSFFFQQQISILSGSLYSHKFIWFSFTCCRKPQGKKLTICCTYQGQIGIHFLQEASEKKIDCVALLKVKLVLIHLWYEASQQKNDYFSPLVRVKLVLIHLLQEASKEKKWIFYCNRKVQIHYNRLFLIPTRHCQVNVMQFSCRV